MVETVTEDELAVGGEERGRLAPATHRTHRAPVHVAQVSRDERVALALWKWPSQALGDRDGRFTGHGTPDRERRQRLYHPQKLVVARWLGHEAVAPRPADARLEVEPLEPGDHSGKLFIRLLE